MRVFLLLSCLLMRNAVLAVTTTEEAAVRAVCQSVLSQDDAFIAGFVRLAFHDCVGGGCDGCINIDLPDNSGLRRYMKVLEEEYDNADNGITMSRADYWALCAAEAVQLGFEKSEAGNTDPTLAPPVTVNFGRVDCAEDGRRPTTTTVDEYPSAHDGLEATLEFFATVMGLDAEEVVALLGAHTLGMAHSQSSGFQNPWVRDKNALDNQYFIDMIDNNAGWIQENVNNDTDQRWQWVHERGPALLMLNSDMCLAFDIKPESTGEVTGDLGATQQSSTYAYVSNYASNNAQWLADFGLVFTKMIENGYTDLSAAVGERELEELEQVLQVLVKEAQEELKMTKEADVENKLLTRYLPKIMAERGGMNGYRQSRPRTTTTLAGVEGQREMLEERGKKPGGKGKGGKKTRTTTPAGTPISASPTPVTTPAQTTPAPTTPTADTRRALEELVEMLEERGKKPGGKGKGGKKPKTTTPAGTPTSASPTPVTAPAQTTPAPTTPTADTRRALQELAEMLEQRGKTPGGKGKGGKKPRTTTPGTPTAAPTTETIASMKRARELLELLVERGNYGRAKIGKPRTTTKAPQTVPANEAKREMIMLMDLLEELM